MGWGVDRGDKGQELWCLAMEGDPRSREGSLGKGVALQLGCSMSRSSWGQCQLNGWPDPSAQPCSCGVFAFVPLVSPDNPLPAPSRLERALSAWHTWQVWASFAGCH